MGQVPSYGLKEWRGDSQYKEVMGRNLTQEVDPVEEGWVCGWNLAGKGWVEITTEAGHNRCWRIWVDKGNEVAVQAGSNLFPFPICRSIIIKYTFKCLCHVDMGELC